jgi:hypothetical protein
VKKLGSIPGMEGGTEGLREMGQQDTQPEHTSDSPPLACCSGNLPIPFPCDHNRLTEAGPEIQI